MTATRPTLLVTAANGQLGRLVVDQLLDAAPAATIVAAARRPDDLSAYAARGVELRRADYDDPASLDEAFRGVDRLLLISSNDLGNRVAQHRNAIEAARRAGVGLVAYTSVLHADTSPLGLAEEHRQTEAMLRESGVPFVLLRNGWYLENYAMALGSGVEHGAVLGSAGQGRVSAAGRADYAAAAVKVLLTDEDWAGRALELAGDDSFTLPELAAEAAAQSGRTIAYHDLPEADYKAALVGVGLPEPLAALLADSDIGITKGGLFDDGRTLSRLIGRPTLPWREAVRGMLKRD